MMDSHAKPLPVPDLDSEAYWQGCKRHELLIQRCQDCGTFRFPPSPLCCRCNSRNTEWTPVSGKGTIYSWVVVHHPVYPVFAAEVPYAVVLVALDEDPQVRIPGNILDCPLGEIRGGMAVEVVFEDVTEEVALPKWRPLKEG